MNPSRAARSATLRNLRGGLVVSCQALPGEPLHGPRFMARMALAAVRGGAVGIRANGPADIRAIRCTVNVPIIGLWKGGSRGLSITPTFRHAAAVARAGADLVALDATQDPRPDGISLSETIARLHGEFGVGVVADVGDFRTGLAAEAAGADAVATTLSGYLTSRPPPPGPDLQLVRRLAAHLHTPVIAEGRFATPDQARRALASGALAVVVGAAITRPQTITSRFVAAIGPRTRRGGAR